MSNLNLTVAAIGDPKDQVSLSRHGLQGCQMFEGTSASGLAFSVCGKVVAEVPVKESLS